MATPTANLVIVTVRDQKAVYVIQNVASALAKLFILVKSAINVLKGFMVFLSVKSVTVILLGPSQIMVEVLETAAQAKL